MTRWWTAIGAFGGTLMAAALVGALLAPPGGPGGLRVDPGNPGNRGPGGGFLDVLPASATLESFADCGALADWYRDAALENMTAWGHGGSFGVGGGGGGMVVDAVMDGERVMAREGMSQGASQGTAVAQGDFAAGEEFASAPVPAPGQDFSDTNVQESGVDEPDLVKTNGEVIFTIARNRLQVVDVATGEARLLTSLALPQGWGHELFLDGDRLLVLSRGDGAPIAAERRDGRGSTGTRDGDARIAAEPMIAPYTPRSVLTLYDVADPSRPQQVATLEIDGDYASARMIDGIARVVLRSHPAGPPVQPMEIRDAGDEAQALAERRTAIRESTTEDWLPFYRLASAEGTTTEAPVVDCARSVHPGSFSGYGMVTVLSVDVHGDLIPERGTTITADAETVYASTDNLYVAMSRWESAPAPAPAPGGAPGAEPGGATTMIAPAEPGNVRTEIHQFDLADPADARYVASGTVPGQLLNQWSLSEHEGVLRVATTQGETWAPADGATQSSSGVHVLAREGDQLNEIGHVGDLGLGERIYAVRFMGDVGYVVTFRQVDPLYTIDLSDPTAPRVVGELKILGYSAYLHPVGDGLLLGVGQDATEEGMRLGTQLSLFDVSDLANPRKLAGTLIEGANSDAEHNHHAFLWWGPRRLAAIPMERWSFDETGGPDGGSVGQGQESYEQALVAFDVGTTAIAELGRVSHPSGQSPEDAWLARVTRSLVVGDTLYTLSEAGLGANALDDLAPRGWTAFSG